MYHLIPAAAIFVTGSAHFVPARFGADKSLDPDLQAQLYDIASLSNVQIAVGAQ